MKISKKTLLVISGILSISALGLMFVSAADRELFMDLNNAVQHIQQVKIISTTGDDNTFATLSNSGGLVRIDTERFIIGETGNNKNTIVTGANNSSILGGIKNRIGGGNDVIVGGSGNKVGGEYNTIIGGEGNTINYQTCGSYNTIIGGKNNTISGNLTAGCISGASRNYSVIAGGQNNKIHGHYSVVMGNNSSVIGNNSVALGSGTNINANNSFLWTDGNSPDTLQTNDVFVIMAQSGVIINTDTAHSFAKLTIGGPLVLSSSGNQSRVKCGNNEGGGTIKIEKSENNQLCLCSCDGSGWNSMFSKGACSRVCNQSIESPKCGTTVETICSNKGIIYSGTCTNGIVIEGTGAYFVDKNDIVHRSCQTVDGQVDSSCTGKVLRTADEKLACLSRISTCIGGAQYDKAGNPCNSTVKCDWNEIEENGVCVKLGKCLNERGIYNSANNSTLNGFKGGYNYNRYLPKGGNETWTCVDNNTNYDAHSCTFSCDEGYECGYIGQGARVNSHNKYASCIPKNSKCPGDYSIHDGTMDQYNKRATDSPRYGQVFKNPNPNNSNNTWKFFYSKNDPNLNTNEYGCYVVCDPGYHEPIAGEDQYHNRGQCLPNCGDLRRHSTIPYYTSTGHGTMSVSNRWPWKYKELDVYNQMILESDIGLTEEKSCLWSCPEGATPIIIKGTVGNKHAYYLSGEKAGTTIVTEFENFLSDPRNINVYDNGQYSVCRKGCSNKQYFQGYYCSSLGTGYIQDESNCITFNGITNCYRTTSSCNENEFWDYDTRMCIPKGVTLKEKCDIVRASKPYYRRIESTNECKACETPGQYVTENGECALCDNPSAPECTPQ